MLVPNHQHRDWPSHRGQEWSPNRLDPGDSRVDIEITRISWGNPSENHRNMENHGKTIGKLWENHRKTIGKWKTMGKP